MADEWIQKDYDGGAVGTTLDGGISGALTSIVVADGSGLPDGAAGPYVVVIDRGLSDEEKVLVDTRAGNTLAVQQRGYDGTAAVAHLTAATVEHCIDAHSIKQANSLASAMASLGSMAYRNSGMGYVEIPNGTSGYPLIAGASAPAYGQLGVAGLSVELLEHLVPAGTIKATIGATADTGYLLINGATVLNANTAYPYLWAKLPASWKSGTSMVLPDARGRQLFMDDVSTSFTLGAVGGANTVSISSANLPEHTHSIAHDHGSVTTSSDGSHSHGSPTYVAQNSGAVTLGAGFQVGTATLASDGAHTHTADLPNFTGNSGVGTGAGTPMDNRSAHLTVNFQIKVH